MATLTGPHLPPAERTLLLLDISMT